VSVKEQILMNMFETKSTDRVIPLTLGYSAVIDAADYPIVAGLKWLANVRPSGIVYALARDGGMWLYMHRLIAGTREGFYTDHIDGNGLNNRRENLRECTRQQNRGNSGKSKTKRAPGSRYKGVSKNGKYWRAIYAGRYLGSFSIEKEAAGAYDAAVRVELGEFARLNLSENGDIEKCS